MWRGMRCGRWIEGMVGGLRAWWVDWGHWMCYSRIRMNQGGNGIFGDGKGMNKFSISMDRC